MDKSNLLLLYVATGLRVLSARLVLLLTLALTFTLFAWAMGLPTYERIAVATIFAAMVFVPVLSMDNGHKKDRAVVAPEGK